MDPYETNLYYQIVLIVSALLLFLFIFFRGSIVVQQSFLKVHGEKMMVEVLSTERERKRVAEDLHDETGGIIYSLLRKAESVVPKDAASSGILEDIRKDIGLLDESIQDVSSGLVPAQLQNEGLGYAIQDLVMRRDGEAGICIDYLADDLPVIDHVTSLHLYRVVKEIVHNCIKHSSATSLTIRLSHSENMLTLQLTDDGIGFDLTNKPRTKNGLGMGSIYNRIASIKGTLYLDSENGCNWIISVPLNGCM
ncbi:MAG: hypothetical protein EOO13_17315 [Chitinophagaceae bacterium]|nr:MAG: hypothetical protein EOO13_17315 [Chitinophagaceae bacterium]